MPSSAFGSTEPTPIKRAPSRLRRWLREPLLQFLLIGLLLFVVYRALHSDALARDASNRVVLTQDDLRQMTVAWLAQGRPPPTPEQMRNWSRGKCAKRSCTAGVPGGLFAPMIVLGAQIGLMYGSVCDQWLPGVASNPMAYAIVGMAAFFTAVVRAPLTGIILATEMTGSATLLLPMLASCFAAMAVPTLLRIAPIYDSLK